MSDRTTSTKPPPEETIEVVDRTTALIIVGLIIVFLLTVAIVLIVYRYCKKKKLKAPLEKKKKVAPDYYSDRRVELDHQPSSGTYVTGESGTLDSVDDALAPATTSWPGLDNQKRPSVQASEPAYSTMSGVPATSQKSAPAHPEYYYQAVPTAEPPSALAPQEIPDARRASEPAPPTFDEAEGKAAEQRRASEPPRVLPDLDPSIGRPVSFLDEDLTPMHKASLPPLDRSTDPSCQSLD